MGILSWWKGKEAPEPKTDQKTDLQRGKSAENSEISGMNGAMEVPRPTEVTVFEFGSAAASTDKVTLAGYCPVSDDLEPCRWEILPAACSNAPQFRAVAKKLLFFQKSTACNPGRLRRAEEILRLYEPRMERHRLFRFDEMREQYITNGLRRIRKWEEERGMNMPPQQAEIIEVPVIDAQDVNWMNEEPVVSNQMRGPLTNQHLPGTASMLEPHPNISYSGGGSFLNLSAVPSTAPPPELEGIMDHEMSNKLLP